MARYRPNPPPSRNGVGPSCVVLPPEGPWPTVLDHLAERLPAIGRQIGIPDAFMAAIFSSNVIGPTPLEAEVRKERRSLGLFGCSLFGLGALLLLV